MIWNHSFYSKKEKEEKAVPITNLGCVCHSVRLIFKHTNLCLAGSEGKSRQLWYILRKNG